MSLPSDNAALRHLLNRVTWGPSRWEWERLRQLGVEKYLSAQLSPQTIDDRALEQKLSALRVLRLTPNQLYLAYPNEGEDAQDKAARKQAKNRPADLLREITAQRLLRMTESRRQLYEVMVDFWFNHFNIYGSKSHCKWNVLDFELSVIRPHALGKFSALLLASARHLAMLEYLDNELSSADPRYVEEMFQDEMEALEDEMMMKGSKTRLGLNENYARELLELHTLGVGGGYTQGDVTQAARILTGWSSIKPSKNNPTRPYEFKFKEKLHDPGIKTVCGITYAAEGLAEGEKLLRDLARHPQTAQRLAQKLCQRFVADEPPAALVKSLQQVFLETDGDIRAVLTELFQSTEFWDPACYGAKFKSPLEFVAASLRLSEAQDCQGEELAKRLEKMGQPLYLCEPPTGYPLTQDAWIHPGAVVVRHNFASDLLRTDEKKLATLDQSTLLQENDPGSLGATVLGERMSERTRAVLNANFHLAAPQPREQLTLLLASPDYQMK